VTRTFAALPFVALAVLAPGASAKPAVCRAHTIARALKAAGKPHAVDLIRCGDVTADGRADAVFTVASGGTAGDTSFGVLRADRRLVLYRRGYKVGIARHSDRSFDVLQPHYGPTDPNCCPSSFRLTRWTWTGTRFRAGRARKLDDAPARFYR
jgi:hypothetical protein